LALVFRVRTEEPRESATSACEEKDYDVDVMGSGMSELSQFGFGNKVVCIKTQIGHRTMPWAVDFHKAEVSTLSLIALQKIMRLT
jgi:hypothetical protein